MIAIKSQSETVVVAVTTVTKSKVCCRGIQHSSKLVINLLSWCLAFFLFLLFIFFNYTLQEVEKSKQKDEPKKIGLKVHL